MRRRLVVVFVAFAAVLLAALILPLQRAYVRSHVSAQEAVLAREAYLIAASVHEDLSDGALPDRSKMPAGRFRVVVVDADGIALIDTEGSSGRSFATRPEIVDALAGSPTTGTRFSSTLGSDLVFAAAPVFVDGVVAGAVRVSVSEPVIAEALDRIRVVIFAAAALTLLFAVVTALIFSRWVTRPIGQLSEVARLHAAGDLRPRADADAGPAEVRALAAASNEAADRIAELLEERSRFAADAAHQLRTPLAAMTLRLETLAAEHPGEGTAAALRAAERLNAIADRLLAQARATAAVPVLGDVDAVAVCREVAESFAPVAERRAVTIDVNGDAAAVVRSDPALVMVAVGELLANALDAAPPASTITVGVAARADGATITICDEGPGMPDADIACAFDPFWRRPLREDTLGSTGLGLCQVRAALDAVGGSVHLARRPGKGMVATVELPPCGL